MTLTMPEAKPIPLPRKITTEPRFTDKVFRGVVTSGGLFAGLLLGLIGFFLVFNGFEAMRAAGLSFITGFDWVDAIPEDGQPASYGIGAMLYGTMVTGILARLWVYQLQLVPRCFFHTTHRSGLKNQWWWSLM